MFCDRDSQYFDQNDRLIGEAVITYLKYRPAEAPPQKAADSDAGPKKAERIRPMENQDSKHYWQGLRDGNLLLQQCSSCQTLRHPPQPMCEQCQSLEWHCLEASGRGEVYSYTAVHYPEIPPFDSPNCIAIVDLEEGVRLASQIEGVEPEDIYIGMPVCTEIRQVQDGLSLPIFKPVES